MGRIIHDYPIYYGKIRNVPNHQPVLAFAVEKLGKK
jgi:hypothetical protein